MITTNRASFRILFAILVALLMGMCQTSYGQSTNSVPTPSGLVAWWTGNGTARDIVGGNNGTVIGGVTFAPGIVGEAFSFDGSAKTGIRVPDSAALSFTKSLTIEGWIKIVSLTDGFILMRGDDRAGLEPYFLKLDRSTGDSPKGQTR